MWVRQVAVVFVCAAALAVAACGSGAGHQPVPSRPTPNLTSVDETATVLAPSAATPTPEASASTSDTGSSVLPLLLGDAFNGADTSAIGAGDATLQQYLLTASDLPSGYALVDASTERVHDGISSSGTIDVALASLTKGRPGDASATLVLSMAMKFSDLRDLDTAFAGLSGDALTSQLSGSGLPTGLFTDVKALPTDGLGGRATGFSLTMDLGSLLKTITGALGGTDATPPALPSGVPSQVRLRIYIFGQAQYAGAVMVADYGTPDARLDLLALSKIAESRLPTAP
jgi:hypothetical protein